MQLLQGKRAVIFDLDGTVVDSLGIWSEVDMRLARALGADGFDREHVRRLRESCLERFHDAPNPYTLFCGEFAKYLGSSLSAEEAHAVRYRISRGMLRNEVRLRDGVEAVIRRLKERGVRMCVATTTKRANIDIYCDVNEAIRSELKLKDWFEFFITIEDVTRIKPDPECHIRALERLGVPAGAVLVIEDSAVGVKAAQAAGLDVAVVRERHSESERAWLKTHATAYFDDFAELLAAIA